MRPRSMYPSHRSAVIASGMARINAALTSSADACPVSSHWRRASWSNACGGVRILQSMSSTTTWSMASGKSAAARNAIRDPIECPTSVNVLLAASPWRCSRAHATTSAASAAGENVSSSPIGVRPCPRRSSVSNDGERSDSCDDDAHRSRTPSHVPENDSRPWTRTTSGGFLPLPAWNVERTLGAAMAIAPRSIVVGRARSAMIKSDSGNGR